MFTVRQFEARTLTWWADQRDAIDFDPPYQRRGGLWSIRDKAFLIDSILNKYDIPKIYIADFTFGPSPLNPGNRQFAVIDGKQRFESILDFFDGRITLNNDFVWSDDPSLRLARLSYRDLRENYPSVATRFENYNLTVMSVITDEEGKINELFVRLNRNKTLTGPEIRNAMKGIVPKLIRDLAKDELFTDRVRFSTQRAQDLDIAGKFLLVEFRGRLVETKRVSLDRFVREGENADAGTADFERASSRVAVIMSAMNEVFVHRDVLLSTQGPMVPYYWLIRSVSNGEQHQIRPFLVAFDEARKLNKARARRSRTIDGVDTELAEYDQMNRSINDAASIEGRFEILVRRFSIFRECGEVKCIPAS
jgi:hypothetical protein